MDKPMASGSEEEAGTEWQKKETSVNSFLYDRDELEDSTCSSFSQES
jgi:hypothetical protein